MDTYTLNDFLDMDVPKLFGFWCMVKLDAIELPEPKDYADAYSEFEGHLIKDICEYLANEGINKEKT